MIHAKKMKLYHQLTPYIRINSKWIKNLNISHDTIKVLEENISRKISDIPRGNIFANISPRTREIKEKKIRKETTRLKHGTQKSLRKDTHNMFYLHFRKLDGAGICHRNDLFIYEGHVSSGHGVNDV